MTPLGPQDAVLVIDVQRKYAADQGPFAIEGAAALVARLAAFAEAARAARSLLVWVTRERRPGVSMGPATEASAGDVDWFSGPPAALDERLGAREGEVRVVKPRQSSFYGTDLEVVLRSQRIQRVVLTGVTTNICVQATAQDARARDFDVVVVGDLTGSLPVTAPGHELSAAQVQRATLATLAHAVGTVVTAAELLAQ